MISVSGTWVLVVYEQTCSIMVSLLINRVVFFLNDDKIRLFMTKVWFNYASWLLQKHNLFNYNCLTISILIFNSASKNLSFSALYQGILLILSSSLVTKVMKQTYSWNTVRE